MCPLVPFISPFNAQVRYRPYLKVSGIAWEKKGG